ncbi:unnamed protein product [Effrenium voratum]|nr:unnamed protein product [Effrenium voratum]
MLSDESLMRMGPPPGLGHPGDSSENFPDGTGWHEWQDPAGSSQIWGGVLESYNMLDSILAMSLGRLIDEDSPTSKDPWAQKMEHFSQMLTPCSELEPMPPGFGPEAESKTWRESAPELKGWSSSAAWLEGDPASWASDAGERESTGRAQATPARRSGAFEAAPGTAARSCGFPFLRKAQDAGGFFAKDEASSARMCCPFPEPKQSKAREARPKKEEPKPLTPGLIAKDFLGGGERSLPNETDKEEFADLTRETLLKLLDSDDEEKAQDDEAWESQSRPGKAKRSRGAAKKKSKAAGVVAEFLLLPKSEELQAFEFVPKLYGRSGTNMKRIARSCQGKVRLRGRGSRYLEVHNREAPMPLRLYLSCPDRDSFEVGNRHVVTLLKRLEKEFFKWRGQMKPKNRLEKPQEPDPPGLYVMSILLDRDEGLSMDYVI